MMSRIPSTTTVGVPVDYFDVHIHVPRIIWSTEEGDTRHSFAGDSGTRPRGSCPCINTGNAVVWLARWRDVEYGQSAGSQTSWSWTAETSWGKHFDKFHNRASYLLESMNR
jgi:hypothetical protein